VANWYDDKDRLEANGQYGALEKVMEREVLDIAHATTAKLVPLCVAYSKVKRYAKLFACLDHLEANVRAGDNLDVAGPTSMKSNIAPLPDVLRAEAYLELAQYDAAAAAAARSDKPFPEENSLSYYSEFFLRVRALTVLTLANFFRSDRKAAERYQSALENMSTGFVGGIVKRRVKNIALTKTYMASGRYDLALETIRSGSLGFNVGSALADLLIGASARGQSWFAYAEIPKLFMLNRCLLETGQVAEAKAGYDELLKMDQSRENGEILWIALYDRGRIAEKEGDRRGAIAFYRRGVDIIEQQRASINTEANKIGFVGDKQAVYGRLIAMLVDEGRTGEAFDYVERSKSRALVDMLAAKKDFAAQGANPEKIRQVLAQLDAADNAARVQDEAAKLGEGIGPRNLEVARREVQSAAPALSTLVTVGAVPSDELKVLVGAQEALVEYYYLGQDLYAFVLTRESLQVVKLDAKGLAEEVQAFRRMIEEPSSQDWQGPARALHRRLWRPLEGMVIARQVIVVPHGVLHYVPFVALQQTDGSLLLDRIGFRSLPSASVLKYLKPRMVNGEGRLLAFGNPDLGDPKLDLRFAEAEARLVAGMTANSRLLVRRDASKSNFKNVAALFSRLHFATHGRFRADDPLASGLYLAKEAQDDGVLTVSDLYSMSLDADLVTLSACETGLGRIANGDDVVGLTRGFLYAGTRSIVASLWSVDDEATAGLMKSFYENLATMSKDESLRDAQRRTRQTFPHPYYWAAFGLTGRAD